MRHFPKYALAFFFIPSLILSPSALGQAACDSSVSLTGTLTRADFETYVELPFEVASGVKRIEVQFDYDRDERTTVDLGLLDPVGFRGWSGGNKREFFLEHNAATPSYSTGPVLAGEWALILGVPNIRPGITAQYQADITTHCDTAASTSALASSRGEDWYVGDLHAHSAHSDGSCANSAGDTLPCPAALSVITAAERELDFFALSEHNAVSHHAALAELQALAPATLLLSGREVTTFYGHANAFGTTEFIDFRLQPPAGRGAKELHAQIESLGALLSINHPGSPSGEDCMGCGWRLPETDYSAVAAVEVVNTGFVDLPRGRAHIAFWHDRLNEGYRLTGIAGSDNHTANRPLQQPSAIGNPRTWIWARELSEAALLDGIRAGNVYIDTTPGRNRLTRVSIGGAQMGEQLSLAQFSEAGTFEIEVDLAWESERALHPRWLVDGEVIEEDASDDESVVYNDTQTWNRSLKFSSAEPPRWIRFDLVDARGNTQVIGNPVYFDPAP